MVFKDIPGFPGYQISYCGKVFSQKSSKILAQHLSSHKYLAVTLRVNGKTVARPVHQLVAKTWIPNPERYPFVIHKDDNKQNPHGDNLLWGTAKMNNTWNDTHIKRGLSRRGAVRACETPKYRAAETYEYTPALRANFKKTCKKQGWVFEDFEEMLSHYVYYDAGRATYYFYKKR